MGKRGASACRRARLLVQRSSTASAASAPGLSGGCAGGEIASWIAGSEATASSSWASCRSESTPSEGEGEGEG